MKKEKKEKTAQPPLTQEVLEFAAQQLTDTDVQTVEARLAEVETYVHGRLAAVPVVTEPFPHFHAPLLLPEWLYDWIVKGWPRSEFFRWRTPSRKTLDVDRATADGQWEMLPIPLQRFWRLIQQEVFHRIVGRALRSKYEPYFDSQFAQLMPDYQPGEWRQFDLEFESVGLMMQSPGFALQPHVDSSRFSIIYLFYCPVAQDAPDEGTDLYTVPNDLPVPHEMKTYYPPMESLGELPVSTLPYLRNSLGTFLVTPRSLHGVRVKELVDRRVVNCAVRLPQAAVDRIMRSHSQT
jgi:hypothetical protein